MSKGQGLWEHVGNHAFGIVNAGKEFNWLGHYLSGGVDKEYDPGKYPSVNKRLSPKELTVWTT